MRFYLFICHFLRGVFLCKCFKGIKLAMKTRLTLEKCWEGEQIGHLKETYVVHLIGLTFKYWVLNRTIAVELFDWTDCCNEVDISLAEIWHQSREVGDAEAFVAGLLVVQLRGTVRVIALDCQKTRLSPRRSFVPSSYWNVFPSHTNH